MEEKVQNDLTKKYSWGVIIIHWLSAIMIFGLFALGLSLSGMEDNAEKLKLIPIHATGGFVLFLLTAIRSIMYFKVKKPDNIKTGSKFNDKLAVWIHNAFYVLLLFIGISGIVTMEVGGYAMALDTQDLTHVIDIKLLPSLKLHAALAYLTMLLVVMHIVGVVKHYIFTKENTLKRIM